MKLVFWTVILLHTHAMVVMDYTLQCCKGGCSHNTPWMLGDTNVDEILVNMGRV